MKKQSSQRALTAHASVDSPTSFNSTADFAAYIQKIYRFRQAVGDMAMEILIEDELRMVFGKQNSICSDEEKEKITSIASGR